MKLVALALVVFLAGEHAAIARSGDTSWVGEASKNPTAGIFALISSLF